DNVGALASALAAGNRLRPLADVEAALRLYIPQIRLRQTEVPGGADPVRESMKRDKKLQAGVAEAMIRWAVQYGQVGVRAVAFLAAEHTGKKGKQQYRRTFGKDLPGEENLETIKKLPVEGPDETKTTVGELLA